MIQYGLLMVVVGVIDALGWLPHMLVDRHPAGGMLAIILGALVVAIGAVVKKDRFG